MGMERTDRAGRNPLIGRLLAAVITCGALLGQPVRGAEPTGPELAASAANHLGCELYRELARHRVPEANFAFSPASAAAVVAMVSLGTEPEASEAIRSLLVTPQPSPEFHRHFAALLRGLRSDAGRTSLGPHNGFWADKRVPFSPPFLDDLRKTYDVEVARSNFADLRLLRRSINAWASRNTRGAIDDAVPRDMLHPSGTFVAVNTLLLNAEWLHPFRDIETKEEEFHVSPMRTIPLAMMHLKQGLRYAVTDDVELVELPYAGSEIGFVLVVPRHPDRLADLERNLTWKVVSDWDAPLRRLPEPDPPLAGRRNIKDAGQGFFSVRAAAPEVTLAMPKFRFEVRQDLRKAMEEVGLKPLFRDPDVETRSVCLYSAWQTLQIDVDEVKTQVAAVTGGGGLGGGGGPPPIPEKVTVRADHPFLFYICDRSSGLLLALGRVADPTASRDDNETAAEPERIDSPGQTK